MLGRRRLRVQYGKQAVREMKRNADAVETLTLLDGEVCQVKVNKLSSSEQLCGCGLYGIADCVKCHITELQPVK